MELPHCDKSLFTVEMDLERMELRAVCSECNQAVLTYVIIPKAELFPKTEDAVLS